METFLIKALQLILALLILVTVHEFGHYIFSRIFGVKVNRFYLFFNPGFSILKWNPQKGTLMLFSKNDSSAWKTFRVGKEHPEMKNGKPTWRDTVYGIGWLPLGGYCQIAGMVDETQSRKDLASRPEPWEFRTKAAWKRLLVMVAGVLFNFLLAIVIYTGILFWWGEKVTPFENRTEGMNFSAEMKEAGFRDGDILVALDGERINPRDVEFAWKAVQPGARFTVSRADSTGTRHSQVVKVSDKILQTILEKGDKYQTMWTRMPIVVMEPQKGYSAEEAGIKKGDRILKVGNDTTPYADEFFPAMKSYSSKTADILVSRDGTEKSIPVKINDQGKMGVQLYPADSLFQTTRIDYNIFQAIPRGWEVGTGILSTYVSSLKLLFSKDGVKSLGGFGAIGNQFPDRWNWPTFWYMTAFLSVILAFMNIIPIPGLDGGYILFLLWEIITRRKPSDRFLEIANTIGIGFLFLLLVLANGNDIYRMLFK